MKCAKTIREPYAGSKLLNITTQNGLWNAFKRWVNSTADWRLNWISRDEDPTVMLPSEVMTLLEVIHKHKTRANNAMAIKWKYARCNLQDASFNSMTRATFMKTRVCKQPKPEIKINSPVRIKWRDPGRHHRCHSAEV